MRYIVTVKDFYMVEAGSKQEAIDIVDQNELDPYTDKVEVVQVGK